MLRQKMLVVSGRNRYRKRSKDFLQNIGFKVVGPEAARFAPLKDTLNMDQEIPCLIFSSVKLLL